MSSRVEVYTDGSCINNGRHNATAGWAFLFGINDSRNDCGQVVGRQTNNAAELCAVLKALEKADQLGITNLRVKTDSQLIIDTFTDNGWLTSKNTPVENQDLIRNIDGYLSSINVTFSHVRAHGDDSYNIAVDRMAKEAALSGGVIHHFKTFNTFRNFKQFLQDQQEKFSSECEYDDGILTHSQLMHILPRNVTDQNFLRTVRGLRNREFDFLDFVVIYQILTRRWDNVPNSNGYKYTMFEMQRNGYGSTEEFEKEIMYMGRWSTGNIRNVSAEFLHMARIN